MDEMRRLWREVEELRERERFYQRRYHAIVLANHIDHYRQSTLVRDSLDPYKYAWRGRE